MINALITNVSAVWLLHFVRSPLVAFIYAFTTNKLQTSEITLPVSLV